jgi:hypothetical protein
MPTVATQRGVVNVIRFQWSALLDAKTCPLCIGWDGAVRDSITDFPEPPLHGHCRCLIIGIAENDPYVPNANGIEPDPILVDRYMNGVAGFYALPFLSLAAELNSGMPIGYLVSVENARFVLWHEGEEILRGDFQDVIDYMGAI